MRLSLVVVSLVWGSSAVASAHVVLAYPPARYSMDQIKDPPCGVAGNPPDGGSPTVLIAGETIDVIVDEFVGHEGTMRFAFDPSGKDAFSMPEAFDDLDDPDVIATFPDGPGEGVVHYDITVPETPCNPCTLQLIQIMNDATFGPGDDDMYFTCADIVIELPGAGTGPSDDSGGDDSGDDMLPADDGGPIGTAGDGLDGADDGSGTDAASEGGATDSAASDEDDAGCACRANTDTRATPRTIWLGVIAIGLAFRRRRSRS